MRLLILMNLLIIFPFYNFAKISKVSRPIIVGPANHRSGPHRHHIGPRYVLELQIINSQKILIYWW